MSAVVRTNRQQGIESLVHDQMNQSTAALMIFGLTALA
jgi:hypothetical protein